MSAVAYATPPPAYAGRDVPARPPCAPLSGKSSEGALAIAHVRQQAAQFLFHDGIALAGAGFQPGALEYRDVAAAVANQAGALQFSRGLRDAFPPYAEGARDQFT